MMLWVKPRGARKGLFWPGDPPKKFFDLLFGVGKTKFDWAAPRRTHPNLT